MGGPPVRFAYRNMSERQAVPEKFAKPVWKQNLWYMLFCTIQENLQMYEIIILAHIKMIRLGHEMEKLKKN